MNHSANGAGWRKFWPNPASTKRRYVNKQLNICPGFVVRVVVCVALCAGFQGLCGDSLKLKLVALVVLCVPLAAHADDGVNVCATHICQFKQFVIKKVHPSSGGRERVK